MDDHSCALTPSTNTMYGCHHHNNNEVSIEPWKVVQASQLKTETDWSNILNSDQLVVIKGFAEEFEAVLLYITTTSSYSTSEFLPKVSGACCWH